MIKDTIVDGFQNAPHRSLYNALGLTKEDVEDIMYNNANNLIEGARRDIYGK